ncbi:MAG: hypothetical protein ABIN01_01365 [Ferruginibacter sp.]
MNGENHSELIAKLILSTKRKKRNFSIVEIASDISKLKNQLGSLNEISKVIGISIGMLQQFLSVLKLPSEIQDLFRERKIDSVAIAFLLSKFPAGDAITLVTHIVEKKITSQELKILLPYRKQHKNENILDLVEKLAATKNIKISVIRLPRNIVTKTSNQMSEIIKSIIGDNNFQEIANEGEYVNIKIKKEGEIILRNIAKQKRLSLSELIITLIK